MQNKAFILGPQKVTSHKIMEKLGHVLLEHLPNEESGFKRHKRNVTTVRNVLFGLGDTKEDDHQKQNA